MKTLALSLVLALFLAAPVQAITVQEVTINLLYTMTAGERVAYVAGVFHALTAAGLACEKDTTAYDIVAAMDKRYNANKSTFGPSFAPTAIFDVIKDAGCRFNGTISNNTTSL